MSKNITCDNMQCEFYTDSQGVLVGNVAYMGLKAPTLADLPKINIQMDGKDIRIELNHLGSGYVTP